MDCPGVMAFKGLKNGPKQPPERVLISQGAPEDGGSWPAGEGNRRWSHPGGF